VSLERRNSVPNVRIHWKRYKTYRGAKGHEGILYLHEWDGKPFYWGKTSVSFGQKGEKTGRYGSGYRHWIEGCLRHGGRLYVGEPDLPPGVSLEDTERFLIANHAPTIPPRPRKLRLDLRVENTGVKPVWLPSSY
jgi:hypothetical protein